MIIRQGVIQEITSDATQLESALKKQMDQL